MVIDISRVGKEMGNGEITLDFNYESLSNFLRLLLMLSIYIHIYLSQKLL